ncbi:MAG TPA: alpha/beta fold hydrolase [Patescibacteria group bacterium]
MKRTGFEKINNKDIFYILTEPERTHKKIVIMSHGFRGSSLGPARSFVDFEQILVQHGISCLRFDQPNCGNSEGDFLESSFTEWIKATSHFTQKFLDQGYQIVLLGQSMGATSTMVVAAQPEFINKIPAIILWVPDAKTNIQVDSRKVYEEAGQVYKGQFWIEASDANFFECLDRYQGGIHLVYGEFDKYVSSEDKNRIIAGVKAKHQSVKILLGQDHSPWEHHLAQEVFTEELEFIKEMLP